MKTTETEALEVAEGAVGVAVEDMEEAAVVDLEDMVVAKEDMEEVVMVDIMEEDFKEGKTTRFYGINIRIQKRHKARQNFICYSEL